MLQSTTSIIAYLLLKSQKIIERENKKVKTTTDKEKVQKISAKTVKHKNDIRHAP